MARFTIIITLLLSGGASCPVAAQHVDMHRAEHFTPWLHGSNPAALHAIPVDHVSRAAVSLNTASGPLIDYNASDDALTYTADTRAYFRVNPRVMTRGSIRYDNTTARHVGTTTFIDAAFHPFNITDAADTNRGTAITERYALSGAISARLVHRLHAGVGIEYHTVNHAKRKDLRHKNTLLDMTVTPGITFDVNSHLTAGLSYHYRRVIEGVVYDIYGNTDRQYYPLIDFGNFMGRVTLHGDRGYTSGDTPLYNAIHGASIQLSIHRAAFQFFNEFTYKSRSGYFGEKSTSSICYTEHDGTTISYLALLAVRSGATAHLIKLHATRENIANRENIYRSETTSGGISQITYHGASEVFTRAITDLSLEYVNARGDVAGLPACEFNASASLRDRSQTTSIYPFYRKQHLKSYNALLSASHHHHLSKFFVSSTQGHHDFSRDAIGYALSISYAAGSGAPKTDGVYTTPSADQPSPRGADHLLYREHEYVTMPRLAASFDVDYTYIYSRAVLLRAGVHYAYRRAVERPVYIAGRDFHETTFTVSCHF